MNIQDCYRLIKSRLHLVMQTGVDDFLNEGGLSLEHGENMSLSERNWNRWKS